MFDIENDKRLWCHGWREIEALLDRRIYHSQRTALLQSRLVIRELRGSPPHRQWRVKGLKVLLLEWERFLGQNLNDEA